ncbi:hypothetical protein T05_16124 [Trichinella murrelli]|uniref:Uncharacterized protein n=1 Tax=Trichinella murrelli TaxID=144512 RepID=A0A0V0T310_9BILA|nr:hypothetical protein T05_16124 [Trichinella murrelli]
MSISPCRIISRSAGWQTLPCGDLPPAGPNCQRLPAGRQLSIVDAPFPRSLRPSQHGDFHKILRAPPF